MVIFNGGNNNLYIQFNFIIISFFFLFFIREKNYLAHVRQILTTNNYNLSSKVIYNFFVIKT